MTAVTLIRHAIEFSDHFAMKMIEDMRDAPLTQPTARGGNHPLWIVGHLAVSEAGLRGLATGEDSPLQHWDDLFAPGSQPTADADRYPSYDEVIAAFRNQREQTLSLLSGLKDADLQQPAKRTIPGAEAAFSTVGKVLNFLPMHQEFHMGQLADARRAAGRMPLMALENIPAS